MLNQELINDALKLPSMVVSRKLEFAMMVKSPSVTPLNVAQVASDLSVAVLPTLLLSASATLQSALLVLALPMSLVIAALRAFLPLPPVTLLVLLVLSVYQLMVLKVRARLEINWPSRSELLPASLVSVRVISVL
jgi:hypothetical protein